MANTSPGASLSASSFNNLFTRLDAIRADHLNKDGQNSTANTAFGTAFTTTVASQGATVATNNVQRIRDNLTTLSNSAWIETSFASRITVPSAGTLVTASDFNIWDNTVTAVEAICPNYSRYGQYGNYGNYGNYGAYGNYGHSYSNYYDYRNYYRYGNYVQYRDTSRR